MATMADELKCERCGNAEDMDLYTVDGVCDENGNSIDVPLCAVCTENENYEEKTMAEKAYHLPHATEANKTMCGRAIEVGGRPQVLLTTNTDKKKGTVCGRCKALKAGKERAEKVSAKHRKIRAAAPVEKKERKVGKRQPALLSLGERMPNELRVTFKGKEYLAAVNPDGTILVEGYEEPFNSPSRAGKAITGREVDGWTFWSYGTADGSLKKLDTLRKEHR